MKLYAILKEQRYRSGVTTPVLVPKAYPVKAMAEQALQNGGFKYRPGYAYQWYKHDNEYYEEYANIVELDVEGSYLVNDPTYCHAHRACIIGRGELFGGRNTVYAFANGYGASVVCHEYSQGVELAVVDRELNIVYDTPITDDVVSYIKTEDELKDILSQIKELEARPYET